MTQRSKLRLVLHELGWIGTFAAVAATAAVIAGDVGDIYVTGDDAYWFSTLGYLAEVLVALTVSRWLLLSAHRNDAAARIVCALVLVGSIVAIAVLLGRPPASDVIRWQVEGFPNPQRFPGSQQVKVAVLLLIRTFTGLAIVTGAAVRGLVILRRKRLHPPAPGESERVL